MTWTRRLGTNHKGCSKSQQKLLHLLLKKKKYKKKKTYTPTAQHCVQCSSSKCPARSVMVCQTETAFRSNSPSGITARLRRENMMRRTQVVGGRSKPKNLFICSKHTEGDAKFWLSKIHFCGCWWPSTETFVARVLKQHKPTVSLWSCWGFFPPCRPVQRTCWLS